jgi:hypothetical protein
MPIEWKSAERSSLGHPELAEGSDAQPTKQSVGEWESINFLYSSQLNKGF